MNKLSPMKNTRKVMSSEIATGKGYRSERDKQHNRQERQIKRNW